MKLVLYFFLFLAFLPIQIYAESTDFWSHWGDGKAEISSYQLEIPRYRQHRKGVSVLVFVTEDFLKEQQVKKDFGKDEEVKVLKLNHVRNFQTGAYSYNTMLSVFSPLDSWKLEGAKYLPVMPIKTSFAAYEWCGNYYSQINARNNSFEYVRHSYFQNEADTEKTIKLHNDGFTEDDIFIRVRELTKKFKPGSYKMLTSLFYTRLRHQRPQWIKAEVSKTSLSESYQTAEQSFNVDLFEIKSSVRHYNIYVEKAYPHRIIAWKIDYLDQGENLVERGALIKSTRADYWNMNDNQDKLDIF